MSHANLSRLCSRQNGAANSRRDMEKVDYIFIYSSLLCVNIYRPCRNLIYCTVLFIRPLVCMFYMTSALYCKFHFNDWIPGFPLHHGNHSALSYKRDIAYLYLHGWMVFYVFPPFAATLRPHFLQIGYLAYPQGQPRIFSISKVFQYWPGVRLKK